MLGVKLVGFVVLINAGGGEEGEIMGDCKRFFVGVISDVVLSIKM